MPNRPKIFIASSGRSIDIARELQNQLNPVSDIECWCDSGIFSPGKPTIDDLIRVSTEYDMGIFIFNNDDRGKVNEETVEFTRDNVLFEYGLFVANVGTEKSFVFVPKGLRNFHIPTDIKALTYIEFDPTRTTLSQSLVQGVNKVKGVIKKWGQEQQKHLMNQYFQSYYKNAELPLKDKLQIGFDRSFNLLLYMFNTQEFDEFRALDLQFNRWQEIITDGDRNKSQITNTSKAILSSVQNLFETGRCTNFRRIIVISNIVGPTSAEINVLKKIHESEITAKNIRDNIRKKIKKNNEILQTRIMYINPDEHSGEFRIYNDFALFSGKNSDFAIVETTLTSPRPSITDPKCIIIEDQENLILRKKTFDHFWDNHAIPISTFLKKDPPDQDYSVIKANELFTINYQGKEAAIKNASVIIEVAYIEMQKVGDLERRSHYRRAIELLGMMNSNPLLSNDIFLNVFINDFKPKQDFEVDCIGDICEVGDLKNAEKFNKLKNEIKEELELKMKNQSFFVSDSKIATFFMTKTRNECVKTIKTLIANPLKNGIFIFEDRKDNTRDIHVKTPNGSKIYLGYEKGKAIIPNCALLMAQHYFDLFNFAFLKNRSKKDFWIFDFLTYKEIKEVQDGAKATAILFNWPTGITLNIINCNYYDKSFGDNNLTTHKF